MRSLALSGAASLFVAALSTFALEHDAQACGGCFHPPPGENPSVVTDHRMILSISKQQSTLWDQIKYTGSPSSFAWVLPVSGTVEVGLSADVVFQALDQVTATSISEPPRNCPPPPKRSGGGGCSSTTSADALSASQDPRTGPVEVTRHEVVGPYDTVQLKATNANALRDWLTQNGYVVPQDVQPVVDAYVAEKFDFLALKLLPGKGVQDMRPVRVTTQGANAVLPLRMVAVGTGSVVGITLWVLGEGRYEPQNFPTFRIQDAELVWDWAQNRSNYTELRAQKTQESNGRAWDLESSTPTGAQASAAMSGGQASGDYLPIEDADAGQGSKSAEQVRFEDQSHLFSGLSPSAIRVTRLRGDLSRAALGTDLVMIASQDQAELPATRTVDKETGEPLCPVTDAYGNTAMAPRSQAQKYADGDERFSCATSASSESSSVWLGAGVAAVVVTIFRARRRRRERQC